jgi:2-keto-3-deoxy-L-rhamnonate aldolase RhmA
MNQFLERLTGAYAESPVGTFVFSASPIVSEAIACCGFDFVIVDTEHAPVDIMCAAQMLQAVGTTSAIPILRVAWNDPVTVKRVLDAGASTVLFPFIQSADDAQAAVRSTRYPPEGIRGMAGLTRATRFGATPNHYRTANSRIGVVVQLETPEALDRLEEIAAVEGVSAVFIGPTDLSGAMGHAGDSSHPDVQRAVKDAARRCRALNKPIGTFAGSAEIAESYFAAGFSFVVLTSDLGLLTATARSTLTGLRAKLTGTEKLGRTKA